MTRTPLYGRMMSTPLLVSSLIHHAARFHGGQEIVARAADGSLFRYTYRDCERRARRLARALIRLGVQPGDRIGTLAFNGYRHLELYYGVSGMGAVLHTVNPRLYLEQIIYILNHAADRTICFDPVLAPLVESLIPQCPKVEHWVCLCGESEAPTLAGAGCLAYDALLAVEDEDYQWPQFDERCASSLCYTSGTTGHPKGVLYSHRSTVLHTLASLTADAVPCSAADVVLPIVPMFHANAWGMVYAAPVVGAKLVLPGPKLDGASLYDLMERERVTNAGAVPTIWQGLLAYVDANGLRFSSLRRTCIGGSACPSAMIAKLGEFGVYVQHAWGMTETSPMGTTGQLLAKHAELTDSERLAIRSKQGRAVYGVDLKIVDGEGRELPWDGHSAGEILVRGYWVVEGYFEQDQSPLKDGWFPTGDVGTMDPDGYLALTDRAKDVIKSGGEWISSIQLENIAASHPDVHMAACIAVPHPKWGERPLLVVVRKPESNCSADELLASYQGKVARYAVPDAVVFVESIPLTATGKMHKLKLREQLSDYRLPSR
jgi:3-(methylthio)propionyl---CoA ligase